MVRNASRGCRLRYRAVFRLLLAGVVAMDTTFRYREISYVHKLRTQQNKVRS